MAECCIVLYCILLCTWWMSGTSSIHSPEIEMLLRSVLWKYHLYWYQYKVWRTKVNYHISQKFWQIWWCTKTYLIKVLSFTYLLARFFSYWYHKDRSEYDKLVLMMWLQNLVTGPFLYLFCRIHFNSFTKSCEIGLAYDQINLFLPVIAETCSM